MTIGEVWAWRRYVEAWERLHLLAPAPARRWVFFWRKAVAK